MLINSEILNFYLSRISDTDLKKSFISIISFIEILNDFKLKLRYKEKGMGFDCEIHYLGDNKKELFGGINYPFSFIVNKSHFLFYIRGSKNIIKEKSIKKRFSKNCKWENIESNREEPKFYLRNQEEIDDLLNYIFIEKLKIKKDEFKVFSKDFDEWEIQEPFNTSKETQKERMILTRVGQALFRRKQLIQWGFKCSVTRIDKIQLLIASHIHPWKSANDLEKLDVNNGLLLIPNLDSLFDKHLISFDDSGVIIISKNLNEEEISVLGVNKNMRLRFINDEIRKYLKLHREVFIEVNS